MVFRWWNDEEANASYGMDHFSLKGRNENQRHYGQKQVHQPVNYSHAIVHHQAYPDQILLCNSTNAYSGKVPIGDGIYIS